MKQTIMDITNRSFRQKRAKKEDLGNAIYKFMDKQTDEFLEDNELFLADLLSFFNVVPKVPKTKIQWCGLATDKDLDFKRSSVCVNEDHIVGTNGKILFACVREEEEIGFYQKGRKVSESNEYVQYTHFLEPSPYTTLMKKSQMTLDLIDEVFYYKLPIEDLEILINKDYMDKALLGIEEIEFSVGYESVVKPIQIHNSHFNGTCVLMPMIVKNK